MPRANDELDVRQICDALGLKAPLGQDPAPPMPDSLRVYLQEVDDAGLYNMLVEVLAEMLARQKKR